MQKPPTDILKLKKKGNKCVSKFINSLSQNSKEQNNFDVMKDEWELIEVVSKAPHEGKRPFYCICGTPANNIRIYRNKFTARLLSIAGTCCKKFDFSKEEWELKNELKKISFRYEKELLGFCGTEEEYKRWMLNETHNELSLKHLPRNEMNDITWKRMSNEYAEYILPRLKKGFNQVKNNFEELSKFKYYLLRYYVIHYECFDELYNDVCKAYLNALVKYKSDIHNKWAWCIKKVIENNNKKRLQKRHEIYLLFNRIIQQKKWKMNHLHTTTFQHDLMDNYIRYMKNGVEDKDGKNYEMVSLNEMFKIKDTFDVQECRIYLNYINKKPVLCFTSNNKRFCIYNIATRKFMPKNSIIDA